MRGDAPLESNLAHPITRENYGDAGISLTLNGYQLKVDDMSCVELMISLAGVRYLRKLLPFGLTTASPRWKSDIKS